jgi:hypothetical protein
MYKYIFTLLLGFIYNFGESQSYYYKNLNSIGSGTLYQIIGGKNQFYITVQSSCNQAYSCGILSAIDENGNILWKTIIEHSDIASNSCLVMNDTIYISGNYSPFNNKTQIHKINSDGKILYHNLINDSLHRYSAFNVGDMNWFDGKLVLTGQSFVDDKSKAIIMKVNKNLTLDEIKIDTTKEQSLLRDAIIGPDSFLTCFIDQSNKSRPFDMRRIEKYDKDLNLVWKFIPDTLLSNMINIHGTVLNDGRIAYTYFTWGYPSRLPNVRCLDTVSKQNAWQYDYPKISQHARNIYRMKQLKNGDILLIGEYVSKVSAPHINGSPYLMRLDLNGTRKWERAYVEWDTDGEDKGGVLWDAIELDNGDLMSVGFVRNNGKWDPLLIRTDADGCIDQSTPSCPTVQIFDLMTGAVDVIGDKKTVIMPNPASDYIILKNEDLVFPVRYVMYSHTGQLISSGQTDMSGSVNINSLTSGIYLLNISDQNGKTESIRWVKE